MAFHWNILGPLPLASAGTSWLLAATVFLTRPESPQNRRLALVLVMEGVFVGCAGGMLLTDAPEESRAFRLVNAVAALTLPPLYLLFIGTFRTPLVRPLRVPAVENGLFFAALALPWLVIALPEQFTGAVDGTWFAPWFANPGPWSEPMFQVVGAAYAVGLVAAISTLRRSPPASAERRRLRMFVAAFIVRDAIMAVLLLAYPLHLRFFPEVSHVVYLQTPAVGQLAFAVLIARGILSAQIFEVELRVPSALRIFLSAAFVIGLPSTTGGAAAFIGAPAAVAVLAALLGGLAVTALWRPFVRTRERLLRELTPDFASMDLQARRRQTYRAALETVGCSARAAAERRMLLELRRAFSLTDQDHAELEAVVRRARLEHEVGRRRRFRIERVLGAGSQGRAVLAWDRDLNRRVVLKEFGARRARSRAGALAEARAMARINHPNVVGVYEILRDADPPLIVLEHVPGGSVQDLLDHEGRLPLDRTLALARDVLQGLERVHAEGIVHCDIKPANVLVGTDRHAKIADFGIARKASEGTHARAGTIGFAAPELLRGLRPDPRSDLYSVGALIRTCLGGRSPSGTADRTAVQENGLSQLRVFESEKRLPRQVMPVLQRALAPAPSDRFASAAEMLAAVDAVKTNRSRTPAGSRLSRTVKRTVTASGA